MDRESFNQMVNNVIDLAKIILPKASNSSDPMEAMIGTMGAIPDTYEWLTLKISFLEPDDLTGLKEWNEYIIQKGKEFCKANNVSMA